MNDSLEYEFQESVRLFNNVYKNDDSYYIFYVTLYGLYKQSLFGNNNCNKPYWFYFNDIIKWNSWKRQYGKTKDEAKKEYIYMVKHICKM
jgi:acyl-CoA-binding protein